MADCQSQNELSTRIVFSPEMRTLVETSLKTKSERSNAASIRELLLLLAVTTALAKGSTRQVCLCALASPSTCCFASAVDQLIANVLCLRKGGPVW